MLVLSRKISEAIRIGEGIEITILEVSRGRVKLGFNAPRGVSIRRSEIAEPAAVASSMERPTVMFADRLEGACSPPLEAVAAASGV